MTKPHRELQARRNMGFFFRALAVPRMVHLASQHRWGRSKTIAIVLDRTQSAIVHLTGAYVHLVQPFRGLSILPLLA